MPGIDRYTMAMLHMDGANGGTSFPDSNTGGSAHTWTAHSATTDTGTFKFGTASESCGAGTGYIDTPDHADFTLGTGDWTFDCWFNRSGGDGARRLLFGQLDSGGLNGSVYGELNASDFVRATVFYDATNATLVIGTTAITTTGWHHYAIVRTGTTLKLFLDGVQEGGDVAFGGGAGAVPDSATAFSVGRGGEFTTLGWNGYIDEFRLSVGVARWTSNFTPPQQPYDTSIGFDNSFEPQFPENIKIIGY